MATNEFINATRRVLTPTEHKAISKLMNIHQPIIKEMEKWKIQREKLEAKVLDQIDMIGKVLKPIYEQSQASAAGARRSKARVTPNKKTVAKKKSRAKASKR
jgi:hypothetical protein